MGKYVAIFGSIWRPNLYAEGRMYDVCLFICCLRHVDHSFHFLPRFIFET